MSKKLTQRFNDAFVYAFKLHRNQYRKGSRIPYISHLLAVTAIVLEYGGTENQAIAALLHDAVEDQGGYETLSEIKKTFGNEVADIVEGCTDAFTDPKPAWKKRKIAYLKKLAEASELVVLVSLADKIHNARSILYDLKINDGNVWNKFSGGKTGTLWYYQSLTAVFQSSSYTMLAGELKNLVDEITLLASKGE